MKSFYFEHILYEMNMYVRTWNLLLRTEIFFHSDDDPVKRCRHFFCEIFLDKQENHNTIKDI